VRRSRAGFTLLEMLLSTGLFGLVIGISLSVSLSSRDAIDRSVRQATAEAKVRRTMESVLAELAPAGATMLPSDPSGPNGDNRIVFFPLTGVAGGVAVWGEQTEIARRPCASDPDDGVDNDGDGSVDEGEIVLTRDLGGPNQVSYVLCTDVRELYNGETVNGLDDNGNGIADEQGFSLRRVGPLLEVRMCVELGTAGGQVLSAQTSTSITLRN
jgi:type II secretory pathway pseudopilin PulG